MKALPLLVLAALIVGCDTPDDDPPVETPITGTTAPELSMTAPTSAVEGETVEVVGRATDEDQPATTIVVTLGSSLDDELGTFNPVEDGSWSWSGVLSLGDHTLTATATDRDGNDTVSTTAVSIEEAVVVDTDVDSDPDTDVEPPDDDPPTCEITSPAEAITVTLGTSVHFRAAGTDDLTASEDLVFIWWSSLSGVLFAGAESDFILPGRGEHVVRVDVEDSTDHVCSAEIIITVE